jgi:UDP-N-acetylglucosamine--N-acetylmuramyl-(pentapeptide) pyrophosphoryl-undecaprenol N-acetylglucosamine transferase
LEIQAKLNGEIEREKEEDRREQNPCLLVAIRSKSDKYVVDAWSIKNLDKYKLNNGSGCEQLINEINTDKKLTDVEEMVKTLIQEQNSYPGITNKILSKKAEKICVAYDNLEAFFPKEKIVLTGNPVRAEVTQIQNKKVEAFNHFDLNSDKPVLLVIGGSLGALTINRAIEKFAETLTARGLQIIWQTGKNFKSERAHSLPGVHAHTFIKEMDYAYAAADIIVSRAGAMSISELCLVKKPCILVPSPNVSEDHQTKNAIAAEAYIIPSQPGNSVIRELKLDMQFTQWQVECPAI